MSLYISTRRDLLDKVQFASVHHSGMSSLEEHVGVGRQGRVQISGVLRPQIHTGRQHERFHRSVHIWKQRETCRLSHFSRETINSRAIYEVTVAKLERTVHIPSPWLSSRIYARRKRFVIDRTGACPVVTSRASIRARVSLACVYFLSSR